LFVHRVGVSRVERRGVVVWVLEFGAWNLEFGAWYLEISFQKSNRTFGILIFPISIGRQNAENSI